MIWNTDLVAGAEERGAGAEVPLKSPPEVAAIAWSSSFTSPPPGAPPWPKIPSGFLAAGAANRKPECLPGLFINTFFCVCLFITPHHLALEANQLFKLRKSKQHNNALVITPGLAGSSNSDDRLILVKSMSPMGGALGVTEWPLALAFLAALWSLNWMVAVLASALMLTRETSPNLEKCFVKTGCFNKMLGTFSQMIDLMLMSSSLDVKRSKCLTPPRNRTEIMIIFAI